MAKIIPIQFRRSRLPRRLLNDGWWLEQPPAQTSVITFPNRSAPRPKAEEKEKIMHLILINPGK
jgi:hypothetical protein